MAPLYQPREYSADDRSRLVAEEPDCTTPPACLRRAYCSTGWAAFGGRTARGDLREDVWFTWRARRAGARTPFCTEALIHHAVTPRGGRDYVEERRRLRQVPAWRRSSLLVAAAPYALELRRHAGERGGEDWKGVAAVDAAADLIGAAALLRGSLARRTAVL
jgi:hypothetical protein